MLPDSVVSLSVAYQVVAITLARLGPAELLAAIIHVTAKVSGSGLAAYLRTVPGFITLPPDLLRAFALTPSRMRRLHDICQAMRVSAERARVLVRLAGFQRAEHLFVALLAESWQWLFQQGVPRKTVCCFLGVEHCANFHRACLRAGVRPPWARDSCSPHAFGVVETAFGV